MSRDKVASRGSISTTLHISMCSDLARHLSQPLKAILVCPQLPAPTHTYHDTLSQCSLAPQKPPPAQRPLARLTPSSFPTDIIGLHPARQHLRNSHDANPARCGYEDKRR